MTDTDEITRLRDENERLLSLLRRMYDNQTEPECPSDGGDGKCDADPCTCGWTKWFEESCELNRELRAVFAPFTSEQENSND